MGIESSPELKGTWYESDRRREGIAKLALYVAFEHEMKEADEKLVTREEAIERARSLTFNPEDYDPAA